MSRHRAGDYRANSNASPNPGHWAGATLAARENSRAQRPSPPTNTWMETTTTASTPSGWRYPLAVTGPRTPPSPTVTRHRHEPPLGMRTPLLRTRIVEAKLPHRWARSALQPSHVRVRVAATAPVHTQKEMPR